MGNYGSFLFMFDVLHGTATIPHQRQQGFGLPQGVYEEPWYEQLWWPFLKVKKAGVLPRKSANPLAEQQVGTLETAIITADGRLIEVG